MLSVNICQCFTPSQNFTITVTVGASEFHVMQQKTVFLKNVALRIDTGYDKHAGYHIALN